MSQIFTAFLSPLPERGGQKKEEERVNVPFYPFFRSLPFSSITMAATPRVSIATTLVLKEGKERVVVPFIFFPGVCEGLELLEWLVFFLRSFVARGLRLWKRGKLLLSLSLSLPAAILLRGELRRWRWWGCFLLQLPLFTTHPFHRSIVARNEVGERYTYSRRRECAFTTTTIYAHAYTPFFSSDAAVAT